MCIRDSWNAVCTLNGMCRSLCTFSTASVAAPSEAPAARLNETVTTGNCPWWFTDSGDVRFSKWVKALSGTAPPFTVEATGGVADPVDVVPESAVDAVAVAVIKLLEDCLLYTSRCV